MQEAPGSVGAPGRIRTADPQIRRLTPSAENSADFCKPDASRSLSDQSGKPAFANRKRALVAPRTRAERERLARNLPEVVHEIRHPYRERLLDLVQVQDERALSLGQLSERQRNEEGH
jgi:hypothetical protein